MSPRPTTIPGELVRRGVTLSAANREDLRRQQNAPATGKTTVIRFDPNAPAPPPPREPSTAVRRLTGSTLPEVIEAHERFLAGVLDGAWEGILAAFERVQYSQRHDASTTPFSALLDRALAGVEQERRAGWSAGTLEPPGGAS